MIARILDLYFPDKDWAVEVAVEGLEEVDAAIVIVFESSLSPIFFLFPSFFLFFVDLTEGIEELMGLNNITIYPNPANESLFVAFENQSGSAFKLLVSDRVGRIIQTIDVQDEDQNFVTMNVSALANGMYSILFVGQNSSFTKSFIVAK